MIYLTSTNEAVIIAVQEKISQNCQLPNSIGTQSWSHPPIKAINQDLWFIPKPPVEGWGNETYFTQSQMMDGIDTTDIVEMERDESWFPAPAEIV